MTQFASFTIPPGKLCAIVASIVTLGTSALVALAAAAIIAATYVLSLALNALGELAHTISTLYGHSDSFTQLLILVLVTIALWKCGKLFVRPSRKA